MNILRSVTCATLVTAMLSVLGCSSAGNSNPAGNAGSGAGASGTGTSGTGASADSLSGVAASGDPLVGATVTLKDQNGNTQAATTASDGSFSINVTGLTAPFLLQVVSADGMTTYYSASASPASSNPTANLDQYTDLAIRAYFAALNGSDVSTVFADVSAATVLPAQADLNNLADALNDMLQPTLTADSVASAGSFNIFDTAFAANETGFDALLHDTTYTSAGAGSSAASYSISTSGANGEVLTQDGTVAVVSGQINVSGTNTSQANGTTTASTSSFDTISVAASSPQQQTDEQAALAGIQALWSNLVATAQSKGSALSASDLAPYFDANFLDSTLNAAAFETYLANRLIAYVTSGQATGSIGQVYAFSDPAGGAAQITAQTLLTVSTSSGSYSVDMSPNEGVDNGLGWGYIQESDGSYALYGNQDVAETAFQVETSVEYDNCGTTGGPNCPNEPGLTGTSLHLIGLVPFATPYGGTGPGNPTVSSITVANTGTNAALPSCDPNYALGTAPLTLSEALSNGNAQELTGIYGQQAVLFDDTGIGSCAPNSLLFFAPFPPAGTEYQVTYNEANGTTQSTNLFMNAQSSESLQLQSINGENPSTFLASNNVAAGGFTGTSLSLSWPLPTTFALRSITVTVEAIDNASCTTLSESVSYLSPTATGDTVTLPDPGVGADYSIIIGFNGADGESVLDAIALYGAIPSTTTCL